MWNYHPDVVVETFVRFHPGRMFTLQERGLPNPSTYDKSKLLQIASVAPGSFNAAVLYAATAYVRALTIGAIG